MNTYERLIRPWLLKMDPERAHERVCGLIEFTGELPFSYVLASRFFRAQNADKLRSPVLGLNFKNPIGLAAGFDKDCRMLDFLPALGFGFIEAGSVTLHAQPGNPKPRLFRLKEFEALINQMGFNGEGAQCCAGRLNKLKKLGIPLGINLGLNANAPKEEAPERYGETFRVLEPYGDYFAINVSSPNTTGLRDLQERRALERILIAIQIENKNHKPVLVKISPDLDEGAIEVLAELALKLASGIIATNTTISRENLPGDVLKIHGGLSGAPLRSRSTEIIARIYKMTQGKLPIIGVGGIFSGADAFEKIRAGASLVQIYTALVYRGPGVVCEILEQLYELVKSNGFNSVAAAVGTGVAL
jgi:dihydroorotate dehydrogenase